MPAVPAPRIEEEISRLESGIRELKIRYDMFFAGALSREPFELRNRLEGLIRRYANAPIRKYEHQFHFNALIARFNCLSELWGKTMRDREEGDRPAPAVVERAGQRERTLAICRVQDPERSEDALRQLHARFLEARKRAGVQNGRVPFKAFARKIASQTKSLRESSGCKHVELRIVVSDRRVLLKARPGH